MTTTSDVVRHHYRHFNAAALVDAAHEFVEHLEGGGKMLIATIVAPLICARVLGW